MMDARTPLYLLLMAALGGCAVAVHAPPGSYDERHYQPPPRFAPYHGYRYRNPDGLVVVYDSGLSLYLVLGQTGLYWLDGRYYRERSGYWEYGAHRAGPWTRSRVESLPPGLRKRYEEEHRPRHEERRAPDDRRAPPPPARGRDDRGRDPGDDPRRDQGRDKGHDQGRDQGRDGKDWRNPDREEYRPYPGR